MFFYWFHVCRGTAFGQALKSNLQPPCGESWTGLETALTDVGGPRDRSRVGGLRHHLPAVRQKCPLVTRPVDLTRGLSCPWLDRENKLATAISRHWLANASPSGADISCSGRDLTFRCKQKLAEKSLGSMLPSFLTGPCLRASYPRPTKSQPASRRGAWVGSGQA